MIPQSDAQFVHQCDNGLVLVGEQMPWLNSVAFAIALPAGSAYDGEERAGLAALTTEMILRGAGSRDSRRFLEDLEHLGVMWSESVSRQHIVLLATMQADRIKQALPIFADVVLRPWLPAEELDAAKAGLIQEIRAEEDVPEIKLNRQLRRRFFPYPWNRSTQGQEGSLSALTLHDLQRYVETHFLPRGSIIGVAGCFDWDEVVAQVGDLFDHWKGDSPQPPQWRWEREGIEHLPFESQQTHIGVAFESVRYDDARYFLARAALGILSGGTSARLFMEVREKRGLCYAVGASYHVIKGMAGVFCYSGTTSDRAQETLNVLLGEIHRLQEGIRPDELQRVKAQLKSSLVFQEESSASRACSLVSDWYLFGRLRSVQEIKQAVDELTVEAVNSFLQENPPGGFTIVTLGPEALEVPRAVFQPHLV